MLKPGRPKERWIAVMQEYSPMSPWAETQWRKIQYHMGFADRPDYEAYPLVEAAG